MADPLTVLNRDPRPVRSVGHDLHRRTLAAEHDDADEVKAQKFQPRREDRRQLAF